MSRTLSLGRVAGIQIGLHWTWLIVVGLLTWTLAESVFPANNEGLSEAAYWTMGLVAALLLFASILLHELGHALQARRDNVDIEGITLWLFGGVARFRDTYRSPGAEFRIAAAGPLVTVVIAGVLIAVGALVSLPDGVDGVVWWLGYINVLVLIFNLLPALPLDGGRILHAGLWRAKRDLGWATRVGTAIGVGIGWLMIAGGLFLFFAGPGFGGLWLALIGWFLTITAQAEAQQLAAREALRGVTVERLMSRDPVAVPPTMTIETFVDEFGLGDTFTSYPVVEGDRPIGLLPFEAATELPADRRSQERVRDRMVPRERVAVLRPDQDAGDALTQVITSDVERALVEDQGALVGLVSVTDLRRAVAARGPFGERERQRSGERSAG